MKYSSALLSLVAALPATQGVAFGFVVPTSVSLERAFNGMKPNPTNSPSIGKPKKRQVKINPETCGWVDGSFDHGVTCQGAMTCMLYTSAAVGMAGCCSDSNYQDCGWSNTCLDAKAYAGGKCDSDCMLNSFVRKCTAADAPYCVTWSYPNNGILDYGCSSISSNTVYTVLPRGTDSFGETTSIEIPTLSGNAITAYDTLGSGISSSKARKRTAIGLIVGVVIAGLFVLFFIVVAVFFFFKKKKKQRLLAKEARAVAMAQVNRPRSQHPPQPPQQHNPLPTNGCFPPVPLEQKIGSHSLVHEYAVTPISSPSTPIPAYAHLQYNVPTAPVVPSGQVPAVNQQHSPEGGVHEVDAVSIPRTPAQGGPVYEMEQGK